jgi:hypothetical protein
MANRNYTKAMIKILCKYTSTHLFEMLHYSPTPYSVFPYIQPTSHQAILLVGMLVLVSMS